MTEEIWKDIPGYEGEYQVSNLGRVKSLERIVQVRASRRSRAWEKHISERILRPGPVKTGHLYVVLRHRGNGAPVHQLVLRAFIGPPPPGTEVCHNDGDPTNNRLDNLRYDTRRENILDAYKIGKGARSKLTPDDVREIRELLARGEKGRNVAKAFGVREGTISAIKRGRTFTWVQ